MGQMISAAVFSTIVHEVDNREHEEVSSTIAKLVLGNQANKIRDNVGFDVCEEHLFHSGPYFHRSPRGAGIAIDEQRVLVVSDRCEEWLSKLAHDEFSKICTILESDLAIVLSINDFVDSSGYTLWINGRPVRMLSDDGAETIEVGDTPELERQLKDEGKSNIEVVDEMASLLLPRSLTQSVFRYQFDLWKP